MDLKQNPLCGVDRVSTITSGTPAMHTTQDDAQEKREALLQEHAHIRAEDKTGRMLEFRDLLVQLNEWFDSVAESNNKYQFCEEHEHYRRCQNLEDGVLLTEPINERVGLLRQGSEREASCEKSHPNGEKSLREKSLRDGDVEAFETSLAHMPEEDARHMLQKHGSFRDFVLERIYTQWQGGIEILGRFYDQRC